MLYQWLLWMYMINAVLLINHEIDSAFWREWDLFGMKGGVQGFLIIHFPLLFAILYGLLEVSRCTRAGLIISLLLCSGGLFAFFIHNYFIRKGHTEFTAPVSRFILTATLAVSIPQGAITLYLLTV